MFWRRKKIAEDLKSVTELAGDQIAPGAGTMLLLLGGAALGAAAAYVVSRRRQKKKAASRAALPKSDRST
jgi:LPXTG-motif cell wall-anchored protein